MLKNDVINTINSMPDDVSMADIMYLLYLLDKHYKALNDITANRVYSTDDVRTSILGHQNDS